MAKQKMQVGQVITVKGDKFEVVTISAKVDENDKLLAFRYELWDQADAVAMRKANEVERKRLEKEAAESAKIEGAKKPATNKEDQ